MIPLLCSVLAGAAAPVVPWPPIDPSEQSALLNLVEQIEVHGAGLRPGARVEMDAVDRVIVLHAGADAVRVARFLEGRSEVCPRITTRDGDVLLSCVTERVRGRLRPGGQLELARLRGLPVQEPTWRIKPAWIALAERADCIEPDGDHARALCALKAGKVAAGLRFLGDERRGDRQASVAVLYASFAEEAGDQAKALAWYRRASVEAQWRGLARVAECEMTGNCVLLDEPGGDALDTLPDAAREVVTLRHIRLTALTGPLSGAAAAALASAVASGPGPSVCDRSWVFCHTVLARALRDSIHDGSLGDTAVESFLVVLPVEQPSPLRERTTVLAVAAMEAQGTPGIAGRMLTHRTPGVPKPRLAEHLARIVSLFAQAGDWPRAQFIRDYAGERLPPAVLRRDPWPALDDAIARRVPPPAPVSPADVASNDALLLQISHAKVLTARARMETATWQEVPRP